MTMPNKNSNLPIKLKHRNFDDKVKKHINNQLKQYVNKNKPDGKGYCVYVMECEKPNLSTLVEEVNSEYNVDSMKDLERKYQAAGKSLDAIARDIENTSEERKKLYEQEWGEIPSSQEEIKNMLLEDEQERGSNYVDNLPWTNYVIEADKILYVGYSSDLVRRIKEHLSGNGAIFTSIARPTSLTTVNWFESKKQAREAEKELAEELTTLATTQRESDKQLKKWNREGERIFAKQSWGPW